MKMTVVISVVLLSITGSAYYLKLNKNCDDSLPTHQHILL